MAVRPFGGGDTVLQTPRLLARVRKLNRANLNFWFDLLLFGLISATVASAFLNVQLHTYLGGAMALALIGHLALHWTWLCSVAGRILKVPQQVRLKALVDVAMLAVLVPMLLSGGIVALIYAPAVSRFHSYSCYLCGGLLLVHLALNARWIAARIKGRRAARR